MASVGVFSFPSAISGGNTAGGNSTNNPVPPAIAVKPLSALVSSAAALPQAPVVVATRGETPPAPAVIPVSAVSASPSATITNGGATTNGIVPPLISTSPTPDSVKTPLLTTNTTPPATVNGGMFSDTFQLIDGAPFEELEPDSNGRGPGSITTSESVNGYPLENGSLSECMEQDCTLCQNKYISPRVLTCLHVFCEICLDKLMGDDEAKKLEGLIECPTCNQPTKVGTKGIGALHQDYILTNVLDLSTIEPAMLACTSCKSKEMAISRCNDCANFLCASCDNAHRYMRCFEDHKVVQLEDLRKSSEKVAIHKPLYCSVHPPENLKYFCFNCQIPVCNECLIGEHKGKEHNYQIISEAEKPMRLELENLMKEAKTKIEYCNQTTSNLDASLHDLQNQFETARDLINESFQSFKAVLEKCRENALKNLEKLHSERELKIMELFHNVEKSTEKIENTADRKSVV